MKTTFLLALGLAALAPGTAALTLGATAQTGLTAAPLRALAKPILYMRSMERYSVANGQKFIRFNYEVTNKSAYPASLFTLNASLPPCGSNTSASRTWVDFYNASTNQRIYGFCAATTVDQLDHLWFSLPEGTAPPRAVYIVIFDRLRGIKVRSNNEVTVLTPPPSG